MKKALLIASVLFIAVITTACINKIAVQELNNKAAEFVQKGDYESAISRLQASIDLDSSLYETYYNLGVASTKAKKYEQAISAFENGMKINPNYADFYYSLGVAQSSMADELLEDEVFNEEKQETEKKIISDTDKEKAAAYRRAAIDNLNKYLTMEPNSPEKASIEQLIKTYGEENKTEMDRME